MACSVNQQHVGTEDIPMSAKQHVHFNKQRPVLKKTAFSVLIQIAVLVSRLDFVSSAHL